MAGEEAVSQGDRGGVTCKKEVCMPKGKQSDIIQVVARRDVLRKAKALAEITGMSVSQVCVMAIVEMAERRGVVLREEPDPNQLALDLG